jgi:hypothetical protein
MAEELEVVGKFGKLKIPIERECVDCHNVFLAKYKTSVRCKTCTAKIRGTPFAIEYRFPDPKTLEIISITITPKQFRLCQLLINPIIEEVSIPKELKITKEYIEKFKRTKNAQAFLTYLTTEHFANMFKATDLILTELVRDAYQRVKETKKDPADIVYMVWDRFFKYIPNEDLQEKIKKASQGVDLKDLKETVKRMKEQNVTENSNKSSGTD